ncbi:DNA polymerase IV [Cohnella sp.]|uniref:DNA polymerase IV n=1 Tax=Cohnella sp. TaxID=1883426 RepID=UPI003567A86D
MKPERIVMLADCQSFYASVEKASNPHLKDKPLVVAGDPERRSGIILAACPLAKAKGITTAETLRTALAKCPEIVIMRPRMQHYIDVSMQITAIYRSFSDLVEPYSIDEQFIDVTGSQSLFGTPLQIAQSIQDKVRKETGIYTRLGISYSKVTAKMACDLWAKKNDLGLFALRKTDLSEKLWPLPVDKMFMAGSRMTAHFITMGMPTIGHVAQTPLAKLKQIMRQKFGRNSDINAEMYYRIANGIDDSPVAPYTHEEPPKQVGHQMTLPRDYYKLEEIKVILLELSELVCQRCRGMGVMGGVVSVGAMGADYDKPTGFHRQSKMPDPTNVTNQVYDAVVRLFNEHWGRYPVRKLGVSLSQLSNGDQYQVSLFDNREKYRALERATDALKQKYGNAVIMRAVSKTDAGQAVDRAGKIGGHYL